MLIWNVLRTFPCLMWNRSLYLEGRERRKKKADHSRLVGGSFNTQGNLHTRLVLVSARQVDLCTHPPARILKVYIEDLTESSHTCSTGGLNNILLSPGSVCRAASKEGKTSRTHLPRAEERVRNFRWLGSSRHVSQQSRPLEDLPHQPFIWNVKDRQIHGDGKWTNG